jgi:hypothetical protein
MVEMILYDQIGAGISEDPHTKKRSASRAPVSDLAGPGRVWGRPSGRGLRGNFGGSLSDGFGDGTGGTGGDGTGGTGGDGTGGTGGTWLNPGDNTTTDTSADNPTNSIKLISNESPREFKRIIKAQTKIYSKEYRVSRDGESNPSDYVDIDRVERLMFYFTEHPEKARPAGFTPSHTTFFHLTFALNRDDREAEIVP